MKKSDRYLFLAILLLIAVVVCLALWNRVRLNSPYVAGQSKSRSVTPQAATEPAKDNNGQSQPKPADMARNNSNQSDKGSQGKSDSANSKPATGSTAGSQPTVSTSASSPSREAISSGQADSPGNGASANSNVEQQNSYDRYLTWIALGAAGTSLLFSVLLFLTIRRSRAEADKRLDAIVRQFSSDMEKIKKEEGAPALSKLKDEVEALGKHIDGINTAISRLQSSKAPLDVPKPYSSRQAEISSGFMVPERSSTSREFSVATAPKREQALVLHASRPEPDGTFKVSELSQEPSWNTLYILKVNMQDQSKATLEIQQNPDRFKAAIQAPQQYLAPACHYERDPSPNATWITAAKPGQAVLEESYWKIQKKIEIKFDKS